MLFPAILGQTIYILLFLTTFRVGAFIVPIFAAAEKGSRPAGLGTFFPMALSISRKNATFAAALERCPDLLNRQFQYGGHEANAHFLSLTTAQRLTACAPFQIQAWDECFFPFRKVFGDTCKSAKEASRSHAFFVSRKRGRTADTKMRKL